MKMSTPSQILAIVCALLLLLGGGVSAHQTGTTLEGNLSAAGPSIYMEGSHELKDAEGELLARLSGREHEVDLNAFLGEWVKVSGEWKPTVEAGGKIFEVQSIEAAKQVP